MNSRALLRSTLGLLALGLVATSSGQVEFGMIGGTYSQDFNTLQQSDATWTNNSTLPGWYANRVSGGNYTASTNLGAQLFVPASDLYSFGTGSDRALGSFNSGSTAIAYGFQIINTTGVTLTSVSLSLDVEKYLTSYLFGMIVPNETISASYSFGATSLSSGSWSSAADLSLAGAGTKTLALSAIDWAPGESLWFRWTDSGTFANNSALAIDNLKFTAIPEPSTYALLLGLGTLTITGWRCRRGRRAA